MGIVELRGGEEDYNMPPEQMISGRPPLKQYDTDVAKLPDGAIGFEIPVYDYIALTYVAAEENGEGEIETVIYKINGVGGTTVATLTIAYDASDNISTITKS